MAEGVIDSRSDVRYTVVVVDMETGDVLDVFGPFMGVLEAKLFEEAFNEHHAGYPAQSQVHRISAPGDYSRGDHCMLCG